MPHGLDVGAKLLTPRNDIVDRSAISFGQGDDCAGKSMLSDMVKEEFAQGGTGCFRGGLRASDGVSVARINGLGSERMQRAHSLHSFR